MRILLSLILMLSMSPAELIKVKVTEQHKITRPYTVRVKVGEQCYERTVQVPVECGKDDNLIGLDTLVGIGIGIAIGNQFKNNKDTARFVGGVTGGYIANSMRKRPPCVRSEKRTICEPQYEYMTKYRIIGWNNCAYLDGKKYCKQTDKPLDYLYIKKTVSYSIK